MSKTPILIKASRPKKITVNSIKTSIPSMRTTGLNIKKPGLPIITEDAFVDDTGKNIGVNEIDNSSDNGSDNGSDNSSLSEIEQLLNK